MTKIVIEVRGGVVQAVSSNKPINYVVVDYDNYENGGEVVNDVFEQDLLAETISDHFEDLEIKNFLKRNEF